MPGRRFIEGREQQQTLHLGAVVRSPGAQCRPTGKTHHTNLPTQAGGDGDRFIEVIHQLLGFHIRVVLVYRGAVGRSHRNIDVITLLKEVGSQFIKLAGAHPDPVEEHHCTLSAIAVGHQGALTLRGHRVVQIPLLL